MISETTHTHRHVRLFSTKTAITEALRTGSGAKILRVIVVCIAVMVIHERRPESAFQKEDDPVSQQSPTPPRSGDVNLSISVFSRRSTNGDKTEESAIAKNKMVSDELRFDSRNWSGVSHGRESVIFKSSVNY